MDDYLFHNMNVTQRIHVLSALVSTCMSDKAILHELNTGVARVNRNVTQVHGMPIVMVKIQMLVMA